MYLSALDRICSSCNVYETKIGSSIVPTMERPHCNGSLTQTKMDPMKGFFFGQKVFVSINILRENILDTLIFTSITFLDALASLRAMMESD